jgi:hypothetical protein
MDQLTLSVPDTKLLIHDVLQSNPTIPYQSLEDQFQKLMINPMLALNYPCPMVIIIDAPDECNDKQLWKFIEILLRVQRHTRKSWLG